MATIKTGWLLDNNGEKFAPKTLTSQISTNNGTALEVELENYFSNAETYMNELDEKISEEETERKTEVAVERARIDAFVALEEGSTTGDAELQDIRIKVDGVTAITAGDAVREQINTLDDKIDDEVGKLSSEIVDLETELKKSLVNLGVQEITEGYTENSYINYMWGNVGTLNGSFASDYIEVLSGSIITVSNVGHSLSTDNRGLAFYTDAKIYISGIQYDGNISEYTCEVPSNAKYVRFSTLHENVIISVNLTNEIEKLTDSIEQLSQTSTDSFNSGMIRIFHRIGVVGDSLSSGEIVTTDEEGNHYNDRYEFSWLSNICRKNGLEKAHYSKGGLTTKTWLQWYKSQLESDEVCNMYYLALLTNDISQSEYQLGTINDEAGASTYVGYMKQIISIIHTKAPNAVIMMLSSYSSTGTKSTQFSQMVSDIADLYDYCFFIDFANKSENTLDKSDRVYGGHYDTTGYVNVANDIEKLTNEIVSENYLYFRNFGVYN